MSDLPNANATSIRMNDIINQTAKLQKFNAYAAIITMLVIGSIAIILVVAGQIQKAVTKNTDPDKRQFPASVGFYPLLLGIPMVVVAIIILVGFKKRVSPYIDTMRDASILTSNRLMGVTK